MVKGKHFEFKKKKGGGRQKKQSGKRKLGEWGLHACWGWGIKKKHERTK